MRRKSPLIAGGGPAGSAAAIMLARAGARPMIIERQSETGDALCGGFLSWRTLGTLDKLGISLSGHPVTRLCITSGATMADAPLPGGAIGISRRVMDTALLAAASAAGSAVERGITIREADALRLRLNDGALLEAESLFLATGKYDLRGLARPGHIGPESTLGLRLRLAPHAGLTRLVAGKIELHLFRGGYAGLVLQEDGSANLCMAVRKARLRECGRPEALLKAIGDENPHLGHRISFAATGGIDAIASVPYGWRARDTSHGIFRLGDQAAVIPSLAGEGNGIALASGIAAANAWLLGGAAAAHGFQQDLARRTALPIGAANLLWHAAERPLTARLAILIFRGLPSVAGHLAHLTRIST
jgi:menaquinone-9 beta-reductase